ncbi:RNA polymerase sigma factor [Halalkalibacter flavus]|uniref:RNA polymerase sigma factor n=1 Tax=Halalkalibacter flavus TaxID=3090668 RepID=UPI002FCA2664
MRELGLFRIAHNVTIDYIRKRKPIRLIKELLDLKTDTTASSPEEIAQINESSEELFEALEKLKRSYREVIILRKIKNFSIKETAGILNWSESKVKSTLPRAILNFEKQLQKEGYVYEKSI